MHTTFASSFNLGSLTHFTPTCTFLHTYMVSWLGAKCRDQHQHHFVGEEQFGNHVPPFTKLNFKKIQKKKSYINMTVLLSIVLPDPCIPLYHKKHCPNIFWILQIQIQIYIDAWRLGASSLYSKAGKTQSWWSAHKAAAEPIPKKVTPNGDPERSAPCVPCLMS